MLKLFVINLFVLLGWALSKLNADDGVRISANLLIGNIVGAVVISSLLIMGFYIWRPSRNPNRRELFFASIRKIKQYSSFCYPAD